jgi:hypothetical protein
MSALPDPRKQLAVARERFTFWMDLQRNSVTAARTYFRNRADHWLGEVETLEAMIKYGPDLG